MFSTGSYAIPLPFILTFFLSTQKDITKGRLSGLQNTFISQLQTTEKQVPFSEFSRKTVFSTKWFQ